MLAYRTDNKETIKMTPPSNTYRNNSRKNVFKQRRSSNQATAFRQLAESFVMLFTGVSILYYLNKVPGRKEWTFQILQAWQSLLESSYSIFQSLITFLISISIFLAILFGFILILGALSRFLRVIVFILQKNNFKQHRNHY